MILKVSGGGSGYRVRWREHGELRQKTVESYEEARKLDARKVLRSRGGQRRHPAEPRNISVEAFATQWLARQALTVQPKTLASFRETVNRYIVPAIGVRQVRDVESEDIEAMLQRAVEKSRAGALSRNTLRIIRSVGSLLFSDAVKRLKLDGRNPCEAVKLGTLSQEERVQSVRDRVMSYEQLVRCLNAAQRHCARRDSMVFLTLAETGMRPSECLALQWDDVDLDGRRLSIERTVTLGGEIRRTKTKAVRSVPLSVPLKDALVTWRRRVERVTAKAKRPVPIFLFASRTGDPLQAKPLGRRFRALLRQADLPASLTLYSLRHTFCSQLLASGVKPVDVAKLMGHRNVTTTLTYYSHSLPQDDTPYIDQLTAARQKAAGDLNGDFVRTKGKRKSTTQGKMW